MHWSSIFLAAGLLAAPTLSHSTSGLVSADDVDIEAPITATYVSEVDRKSRSRNNRNPKPTPTPKPSKSSKPGYSSDCPTELSCRMSKFRGCETCGTAPNSELSYVLALSRCTQSSDWTLHGLWPDYAQGGYPCLCLGAVSESYDSEALGPIYNRLIQAWPTCKKGGCGQDYFWCHEREKHGTCMQAAGEVKDQLHYFNLTTTLLDTFKTTGVVKRGCGNKMTCNLGVSQADIKTAQLATGFNPRN